MFTLAQNLPNLLGGLFHEAYLEERHTGAGFGLLKLDTKAADTKLVDLLRKARSKPISDKCLRQFGA